MDRERRAFINQEADRIRARLDIGVPADPEIAVRRLGGEIIRKPRHQMPAEAVIRPKGEAFVIELSEDSFPGRERFSIAHELGHLFLHMGFGNPHLWRLQAAYKDLAMTRLGYNEQEFEAHEFAGAFLMPAEEFRSVAEANKTNGSYKLKSIAEHFGVSIDAAKRRGQWLNLFSWN